MNSNFGVASIFSYSVAQYEWVILGLTGLTSVFFVLSRIVKPKRLNVKIEQEKWNEKESISSIERKIDVLMDKLELILENQGSNRKILTDLINEEIYNNDFHDENGLMDDSFTFGLTSMIKDVTNVIEFPIGHQGTLKSSDLMKRRARS